MTTQSELDLLNACCPGWTESAPGRLACNPAPKGGIIDKAILSEEWFVIFNDDRTNREGYKTRFEAIKAFIGAAA